MDVRMANISFLYRDNIVYVRVSKTMGDIE